VNGAAVDAEPRTFHWGVRVAAACGALVTAWFAFWVGLVGVLTVVGCFLKCEPGSPGDPVGGTLLLLGATVLVGVTVVGLHLAVVGSRRRLGTVVGAAMALALVAVAVTVLAL
jgi:hypothetical protein